MKRWAYTPPSDAVWKGLRKHDITSTESAALFDMSSRLTRLELYHRKREKQIVEIDDNDRMLWGRRLQDTIATGIAEDHGVKVRRLNKYIRIVQSRMGSSFDFEIVGLIEPWEAPDTEMRQMYRERGPGVFEVKCVDFLIFRDQWAVNDDKSIEAPPHIEIQVQHQLHVANRSWGAIGVLVSGHTPKLIVRERYADAGEAIEGAIRKLFAMVKAGTPPEPTWPKDADVVRKMYGYADPGKIYDGRQDESLKELCDQYKGALERETLAIEDKSVARAKILTIIGDAEKALIDGYSLSAGIVGPAHISFEREGYRTFRLTKKKPPVQGKSKSISREVQTA